MTTEELTEDVVTLAPQSERGMIFQVRFDRDQLETIFSALNEGENTIEFIREAALDAARRRSAVAKSANTEAAS